MAARVLRLLAVLGVIAVAGTVVYGASLRTAAAQSAPAVNALEARAARSLLYTDDVLVILSYQLPQQSTIAPAPVSGTPEAWCAWLLDQSGCGDNPVSPTSPTSLLSGAAYVTLCDLSGGATNCLNGGGGVTLFQAAVPRISYGIAGIYVGPGSAIWGDSDVQMCIESSNPPFVTVSLSSCSLISFNGAANVEATQRDQFGQDLRAMLLDIQGFRNLPLNSLVAANLITSAGRVLATEAFAYAPNIAPAYFQAAAQLAVTTPYALNTTPVALVTILEATATAAAWGSFDSAATEIFGPGVSGGTLSALLFLGGGFVVAMIGFPFYRDIAIALAIIAAIGSLNIFVDPKSFEAWALAISLWGILAGWFLLRKAPA